MLTPNLILPSLFDITPERLDQLGIRALILDVDNTLRAHGASEPYDGVLHWIKQMREHNIILMIASNNFKKRIAPFAKQLDLDFFAMSCKPLPIGLSRAINKIALPTHQIALVGDQVFTDIAGGNLKGIYTILISPYTTESGLLWKAKRMLEKPVIWRYNKKEHSK